MQDEVEDPDTGSEGPAEKIEGPVPDLSIPSCFRSFRDGRGRFWCPWLPRKDQVHTASAMLRWSWQRSRQGVPPDPTPGSIPVVPGDLPAPGGGGLRGLGRALHRPPPRGRRDHPDGSGVERSGLAGPVGQAPLIHACRDTGAEGLMVTTHWGTFRLTDEAPLEPPARARQTWTDAGLPPENLQLCEMTREAPRPGVGCGRNR
jgi:hypothetical protein